MRTRYEHELRQYEYSTGLSPPLPLSLLILLLRREMKVLISFLSFPVLGPASVLDDDGADVVGVQRAVGLSDLLQDKGLGHLGHDLLLGNLFHQVAQNVWVMDGWVSEQMQHKTTNTRHAEE
jgi:hypothetical protein